MLGHLGVGKREGEGFVAYGMFGWFGGVAVLGFVVKVEPFGWDKDGIGQCHMRLRMPKILLHDWHLVSPSSLQSLACSGSNVL